MKFPVVDPKWRFAVFGDCLKDVYLLGKFTRFSPEGGQPVFCVNERIEVPGGAGNTARQLESWGVKVDLFGVRCGTKTRFLAGDNYFLRHDEDDDSFGPMTLDDIDWKQYSGFVISDYDKGSLTEGIVGQLIENAHLLGIPCVSDPKHKPPSVYAGSILKPNAAYAKANPRPGGGFVVTRGAAGPVGMCGGEWFACAERPSVKVQSVVGAGDCFAAALLVSLTAGLDLPLASEVANCAGRLYVQKPYNEPVHPAMVAKEAFPQLGKVVEADELTKLPGRVIVANGCFDILHPGHIHTLQWAKNLGGTLVVLINDDASIARIKGVGPKMPLNDRCRVLSGLECVDFICPFSGDSPVAVMRRIGPEVLVKGHDYLGSESSVPNLHGCELKIATPSGYDGHSRNLR